MAVQVPEGRPGNLTPDQEDKLRKLWLALLQLYGVVEAHEESAADAASSTGQSGTADAEKQKKKRFNVFRKNKDDSKAKSATPSVKVAAEDDKYGQTQQYHETLAKLSPETIRETIWVMVKHDHPDALALRFLRARKWDVDKALVMMISTLNWRHSDMHVDDDIMKNGEAGAVADAASSDAKLQKMGSDFLAQIRMGKSFLHGTDKNGRPICVVRARLHKQGEQCEESLERYTVYLIESTRMVLSPPVDTATIIFDMTGFSMANMDYTPVKFMIKCFEANYPESLGAVLIHHSPWLFQGIWKVIRGWLDPVVASKVHFTNNVADLSEFIEPSQIMKELGGDDDWEYEYKEPIPGENDKMKDAATRDALIEDRHTIVKQFEEATIKWIENPEAAEAKAIKDRRDQLAAQLKQGYWKLDPFVRARSFYDRTGVIQPDGTVNWRVAGEPQPEVPKGPETSADDLD
ncbi:CRAL-TRIO domain-containing protein-like protein [Emericellopsis cladophorae]|uniref:CRAL-TRIO domain-containing protein-like protein n=1 Tax=Emericellopsis cladophorae TaxID=2686198 RepID=A0A9P9XX37_9HYPO|nr:CRAL-TRIO domain-containing protein-like protein [Emericellopsis cladophorae]KAI6779458.1 CRAL-TRIO domain-containing protein-like protein [Emericellopsis cladophorae]